MYKDYIFNNGIFLNDLKKAIPVGGLLENGHPFAYATRDGICVRRDLTTSEIKFYLVPGTFEFSIEYWDDVISDFACGGACGANVLSDKFWYCINIIKKSGEVFEFELETTKLSETEVNYNVITDNVYTESLNLYNTHGCNFSYLCSASVNNLVVNMVVDKENLIAGQHISLIHGSINTLDLKNILNLSSDDYILEGFSSNASGDKIGVLLYDKTNSWYAFKIYTRAAQVYSLQGTLTINESDIGTETSFEDGSIKIIYDSFSDSFLIQGVETAIVTDGITTYISYNEFSGTSVDFKPLIRSYFLTKKTNGEGLLIMKLSDLQSHSFQSIKKYSEGVFGFYPNATSDDEYIIVNYPVENLYNASTKTYNGTTRINILNREIANNFITHDGTYVSLCSPFENDKSVIDGVVFYNKEENFTDKFCLDNDIKIFSLYCKYENTYYDITLKAKKAGWTYDDSSKTGQKHLFFWFKLWTDEEIFLTTATSKSMLGTVDGEYKVLSYNNPRIKLTDILKNIAGENIYCYQSISDDTLAKPYIRKYPYIGTQSLIFVNTPQATLYLPTDRVYNLSNDYNSCTKSVFNKSYITEFPTIKQLTGDISKISFNDIFENISLLFNNIFMPKGQSSVFYSYARTEIVPIPDGIDGKGSFLEENIFEINNGVIKFNYLYKGMFEIDLKKFIKASNVVVEDTLWSKISNSDNFVLKIKADNSFYYFIIEIYHNITEITHRIYYKKVDEKDYTSAFVDTLFDFKRKNYFDNSAISINSGNVEYSNPVLEVIAESQFSHTEIGLTKNNGTSNIIKQKTIPNYISSGYSVENFIPNVLDMLDVEFHNRIKTSQALLSLKSWMTTKIKSLLLQEKSFDCRFYDDSVDPTPGYFKTKNAFEVSVTNKVLQKVLENYIGDYVTSFDEDTISIISNSSVGEFLEIIKNEENDFKLLNFTRFIKIWSEFIEFQKFIKGVSGYSYVSTYQDESDFVVESPLAKDGIFDFKRVLPQHMVSSPDKGSVDTHVVLGVKEKIFKNGVVFASSPYFTYSEYSDSNPILPDYSHGSGLVMLYNGSRTNTLARNNIVRQSDVEDLESKNISTLGRYYFIDTSKRLFLKSKNYFGYLSLGASDIVHAGGVLYCQSDYSRPYIESGAINSVQTSDVLSTLLDYAGDMNTSNVPASYLLAYRIFDKLNQSVGVHDGLFAQVANSDVSFPGYKTIPCFSILVVEENKKELYKKLRYRFLNVFEDPFSTAY